MGIFSRLFGGGQDGERAAADEDGDSPVRDTAPPAEPPQAIRGELREDRTEPANGLSHAVAGGAPPLATPLWSWPPRHDRSERVSSSPQNVSASQPPPPEETQVIDDPAAPPASRSRPALPGLPKRAVSMPALTPSGEPPAATEATKPKRADETMIVSPPPAPRVTFRSPTPPAGTPMTPRPPTLPPATQLPSPSPAPAAVARRAKSDSITSAFDQVTGGSPTTAGGPTAGAAHGVSTAQDLEAVRELFNDVAVAHVSQVRDVMLELQHGDPDPAWLDATKPALRSLRAMAAQLELADLCTALDEFCAAVVSSVTNRARITPDDKTELMRRYQRLIELIPQAFELDAERDRREPIIIESLLYQVDGVEKPTIDKLFAVGLNRLDALLAANAGDVVAVSGIRPELAAAIVEQFRAYRATVKAAVSSRDPAAERRELGDLLIMLSLQNDDFARASSAWTDEAKERKRMLRRERDQTYQKIKVALARLGERDQLARLERLSFDERIATLDRFLSAHPATPPRP
jgi:hypothetical protein